MSIHNTNTPAVYVGTYHKYNSGSIAGQWLELDGYDSKSDFLEACQKLHKDEPDPEFMFQDWENVPDAMIGESWVDDGLWEYLEADGDTATKEAFISFYGSWNAEAFEDLYEGEYDSELDFTYQLVDDLGMLDDVPETLQRYFDYESYSRDLFLCDYHYESGYVFRNY